MGVLRVAAVQLRVSRDRASNLRRAAELIDAAAADGAQFVALPECFTGKYGVDLFHGHREALAANADAEAASGSAVLAAAAKRHGVVATGGVIEEHAGKLYNTMPVYGPDGALVAAYRKAFVVGPNVAYDAEDAVPLHGRSAVVSPWGDVLAQCGADADDLAIADVSTDRVAEVRAKLPLADWAE
ncbi:hydrolase [Aureococcus anophagefferens]|nr:hydrolase [Aureococcus anophagefferens]